jgi:hypothetical protein
MESDSLCVLKCVTALRGTGVWTRDVLVLVLAVAGREVPLKDVVALEEMLVEVLAPDRTLVLALAVEDGERAEVEVTFETAVVVLTLLEDSADVDDTAEPTPAVEEAVNMALPADGATPDPAPDDEPAVFDAVALDVLLVEEDWM